jgi:hypothetical protein
MAYELANRDIKFKYIVVLKGDIPVAFANTQLIKIGIESITKNIRSPLWLLKLVNTLLRNRQLHVLFCGNIFLSGEYGVLLKDGLDKTKSFKAIAAGLETIAKQTKKLHAVFAKDFENTTLSITNTLLNMHFTRMHVEPNMIIELQEHWQSFNDYKAALKSKYRIKANKADSKSARLKTKLFTAADLQYYKAQLQVLYQNTINNADFNAQILDLDTYSLLKKEFEKNFIVQGYFFNNELVGFLSAMINGKHLDAHFIGIDYSQNKELAIYPRILNDYVRLGISFKVMQINLGRTASEIKSTLGAKPMALTCYCKHTNHYLNKLLTPLIKTIQIKSFKQHEPFK